MRQTGSGSRTPNSVRLARNCGFEVNKMERFNRAGALAFARNAASLWRAVVFVAAALCLAAPALRAQWVNYRIPGVPRTADGKVNLMAPTPRTPDGKPDLSGTWESAYGYFGDLARDLKPDEVSML